MSALPNERDLHTMETRAAEEQLAQFRRRVSLFGTSTGPTIDRYTASCRGWVEAINAAIRAYYERIFQNGALSQEDLIRAAREIFEPRVQQTCGELLETSRAEQCLDQVSERCDDIVRALDQLERAWAPLSLIRGQPQVIPAMNAVETALKRLDRFRPILTRQSPPVRLITVAVAERRYHVSGKTLARAVADGRLTDHRKPGHATNAPLSLCEDEVARNWPEKARTNQ